MRNRGIVGAFVVGIWMMGAVMVSAHNVDMRDDCDPNDATWTTPPAPPGSGCLLDEGDVTRAEFNVELASPLAVSVVGHQAWRNDPPYLKITFGETVKVRNKGGRNHTFTEVAEFGGGTVPALNGGLSPALECTDADPPVPNQLPGESKTIDDLSVGDHRFQCCRHPWMRALIKVLPED